MAEGPPSELKRDLRKDSVRLDFPDPPEGLLGSIRAPGHHRHAEDEEARCGRHEPVSMFDEHVRLGRGKTRLWERG